MAQTAEDRQTAAKSLRISAHHLRRIRWRELAAELDKTATELEWLAKKSEDKNNG